MGVSSSTPGGPQEERKGGGNDGKMSSLPKNHLSKTSNNSKDRDSVRQDGDFSGLRENGDQWQTHPGVDDYAQQHQRQLHAETLKSPSLSSSLSLSAQQTAQSLYQQNQKKKRIKEQIFQRKHQQEMQSQQDIQRQQSDQQLLNKSQFRLQKIPPFKPKHSKSFQQSSPLVKQNHSYSQHSEQHRQHHQEHQQNSQQIFQQKHTTSNHQYFAARNTSHMKHPPRPPLPISNQTAQTVVDVMYSPENTRSHATGTKTYSPNMTATSQASDVSSQMKSLSLKNSNSNNNSISQQKKSSREMPSTAGSQLKPPPGRSNDEDEWENAWEEDESSSSEGEENDGAEDEDNLSGEPFGAAVAGRPPGDVNAAVSAVLSQPFRPGMDGPHWRADILEERGSGVESASAANAVALQQRKMQSDQQEGDHRSHSLPPLPVQHSQQSGMSASDFHPLRTQQHHQKRPAVSSSQRSLVPVSGTPGSMPVYKTEEEQILTKEADKVLGEGENGVCWDTAPAEPDLDGYEKPNASMFFPLLRVLGKGSFGKVVLVQKRSGHERGGLFAMKILRKSHLVKRRQIERTKTERKVLSVVDHPFIMKLHFAFQTDDKLYLVLDYCAGGELFFHLSRLKKFPERAARIYAAELLLAIGDLHKKGIIYRDLKPENVLLDAEGHVKLGDFGLAKEKIEHPYRGATSMCGTPEYMAPEILQQLGHGFCVDYWGLGMLVYEMMTGLPPWYTPDRQKLFRRLRSAPLDIPTYFSPQAASFISALLQRDPRRRLGVRGVRSVMAHDFFLGLDFRALFSRRIDAPIRPCEGWKAQESTNESNTGSNNNDQRTVSSTKHSNSETASQIKSNELDTVTANFDQTFTRMPVHSVGGHDDGNCSGDEGDREELNENTFVGFTFDEQEPNSESQSYLRRAHSSSNRIPRSSSSKSNGSSPTR